MHISSFLCIIPNEKDIKRRKRNKRNKRNRISPLIIQNLSTLMAHQIVVLDAMCSKGFHSYLLITYWLPNDVSKSDLRIDITSEVYHLFLFFYKGSFLPCFIGLSSGVLVVWPTVNYPSIWFSAWVEFGLGLSYPIKCRGSPMIQLQNKIKIDPYQFTWNKGIFRLSYVCEASFCLKACQVSTKSFSI